MVSGRSSSAGSTRDELDADSGKVGARAWRDAVVEGRRRMRERSRSPLRAGPREYRNT